MSWSHEVGKRLTRSSLWPKVRDRFIANNPQCAASGSKKCLEVHHIVPFSERPDLELADGTGEYCDARDESGAYICNLIVLSDDSKTPAHRFVGHLGSWKSWNPDVVSDSKIWYDKIQRRLGK